jgi:potassium-transporting ATPase KdpC subunit
MTSENKEKFDLKPVLGLAVVSLIICGVLFPLIVTGIGQIFFPYQANGEIVQFNGKPIGSNLIAQTFTLPIFFHPRNDSASGVDPDITLQDAYSQIPTISNVTGISADSITNIVNKNQEGTLWIFGSPYVNVLKINIELIKQYPTVYSGFSAS